VASRAFLGDGRQVLQDAGGEIGHATERTSGLRVDPEADWSATPRPDGAGDATLDR
jgi:hypothetical protein